MRMRNENYTEDEMNTRKTKNCTRDRRGKFERWLGEVSPELIWRWKYQRFIYKKLAAVTRGDCKRLMGFMPPRHGKSELITIRYTAWRLLRDDRLNVILGSYNQKLADKFSRRIKRIVRNAAAVKSSPTYEGGVDAALGGRGGSLVGVGQACVDANVENHPVGETPTPLLRKEGSLFKPLNAANEWEMPGGGVVRSVGVGGGIAGFGAGLIVIDDPVKNRAEAESATYRERVWEWFNDDIYTRMEPNAAIILIQTRWHEDDLAGRLLKEMEDGGERWEVVSLPALAEAQKDKGERIKDKVSKQVRASSFILHPLSFGGGDPLGRKVGQALCPLFPVKTLLRYQKKLGTYSFSALYQQRPSPAEGGQFKREWFKNIVDAAPAGLRWKRGYDLAVSTKTSADYTASFRCAYDKQGNLYIADGFRKRIEYPEQRRYIVGRMNDERDTEHGIESAMHGKAVVQELRRDASVRRFAFREVKVAGDKLTRALTWLNLAEEGKVFLVRGAWIDEFVDEIARFPTGRHDDQIDAVSVAVQMLGTPTKRRSSFSFHWNEVY
jgi:predicted phage terminase large subunit-like protein